MPVSFEWLDGGKKHEVRPMAINGRRELEELALQHAEVKTIQRNRAALALHASILTAKRVLDKRGVVDAKSMWDTGLKQMGLWADQFDWDENEWDDKFHAWLEDHTYGTFCEKAEAKHDSAEAWEEAKTKVEERLAELEEAAQGIERQILEYTHGVNIAELYWRLKAIGAKEITPPGTDDKIPLDWSRDAREEVKDTLADFASDDVVVTFREAERSNDYRLRMEDLEEVEEDEMRGKSESDSDPSTRSNGDSLPSSEPTTEAKSA